MSNSTSYNPWMPVKRSPVKPDDGAGDAAKKPEEKQKPSVLAELLVGLPPETIKVLTDLVAAQTLMAEKLEQNTAGTADVIRAIEAAGKQQEAMAAQLVFHHF